MRSQPYSIFYPSPFHDSLSSDRPIRALQATALSAQRRRTAAAEADAEAAAQRASEVLTVKEAMLRDQNATIAALKAAARAADKNLADKNLADKNLAEKYLADKNMADELQARLDACAVDLERAEAAVDEWRARAAEGDAALSAVRADFSAAQDAWAAAERARAGEVAAIEAGVQELRDAHAAQCARLSETHSHALAAAQAAADKYLADKNLAEKSGAEAVRQMDEVLSVAQQQREIHDAEAARVGAEAAAARARASEAEQRVAVVENEVCVAACYVCHRASATSYEFD